MIVSSRSQDQIIINLPTVFKTDWKPGDVVTFTLPDKGDVTCTVTYVNAFNDHEHFISGDVPNGISFSASYYKDIVTANLDYSYGIQYQIRPVNSDTAAADTRPYTVTKINVNDLYGNKEVGNDTVSPRMKN